MGSLVRVKVKGTIRVRVGGRVREEFVRGPFFYYRG